MISSRSRYVSNKVARVPDRNGVLQSAILPAYPQTLVFHYTEYEWANGDRVDLVAEAFYGDPAAWWRIARVNPEILIWDEVSPGTVIRIPNVS